MSKSTGEFVPDPNIASSDELYRPFVESEQAGSAVGAVDGAEELTRNQPVTATAESHVTPPKVVASGNIYPLRTKVAAALLAGTSLLASCSFVHSKSSAKAKPAAAKSPGTTLPTGGDLDQDAVRQNLTVSTVDPNFCVKVAQSTGDVPVFHPYTDKPELLVQTTDEQIGALERAVPDGPRLWTDAVDLPIRADPTNAAAVLAEVEAKICSNPLLAAGYASVFDNLLVDGLNVGDLNPYLQPYQDPANDNTLAKGYMPLLGQVPNVAPTDAEAQAVTQTEAFEKFAAEIGTLLERFKNIGVDTSGIPITLRVQLAGDGLAAAADQLPPLAFDTQRFLAANKKGILVLEFDSKSGGCIGKFGIDMGDSGAEIPEQGDCLQPSSPPTIVKRRGSPTTGPLITVTTISRTTTTGNHGSTTSSIPRSSTTITIPGRKVPGTTTPPDTAGAPPTTAKSPETTVPVTPPPTVAPPVSPPPTDSPPTSVARY